MITLEIVPGTKIRYQGGEYMITRICDINYVIIENDNSVIEKALISKLEPSESIIEGREISTIKDKDWEAAQHRFSIIQPVLSSDNQRRAIKEVAQQTKIGESTLYRWVNIYNSTRLVSALAPVERTGGKGKSRLSPEIDKIIKEAIDEHYLDNQHKSIQKVCTEVLIHCKDKGLDPPHYNTLRHRIAMISEYNKVKYRLGKAEARKQFDPKIKKFPDALFPLSSIQIDHTPLDIIVVDEEQRQPIGRPWLTLAIDTYSRMIVGMNVSFEHPSAMSVGLCIAQAVLPKEEWLAQRDIFSEWPCWGIMKCIHMDNAKEFRSKMLENACLEYSI
jgi:putative transposase